MKTKFTVTKENLIDSFYETYGKNCEPLIVAAPARINIIGEHIDYNGGKVFPTAIDKYTFVAIRKRNDSRVIFNDLFFEGTFIFDIHDDFMFKKENDYSNYLCGILSCMKNDGIIFDCGFEVLIASNIPSAGGISSSSALECGFAWAVNELFELNFSRKEIALMGQQSEHEFMNVNCGIMDQYIISTGKENFAEILDCSKVEHEFIPLNLGDYRFIVMNTQKQRKLSDSKYNERLTQCEKGLNLINSSDFGTKTENLCSFSVDDLPRIKSIIKDEIIFKRVRHCITENERVLNCVEAFKKDDLLLVGKLLYESHNSLKEDYEVTGIELDTLVNSAKKQNGCIGARMTGAGFGGCAIALVHKDFINEFINNVQNEYKKVIGYEASFFDCKSSDGVKTIE